MRENEHKITTEGYFRTKYFVEKEEGGTYSILTYIRGRDIRLDVVEKFRAIYIYIFLPVFAFHIVAKLCITVSHKFPSFSSMRNGYAIFAVSRLLIHRVTLHHFPPSYYYSQNCWGLYRKILLELRFHFAKHSSWRELVTGFLSQPSSTLAVFSLLSIRREDVLQNRSQEKLVVDRKNFVR